MQTSSQRGRNRSLRGRIRLRHPVRGRQSGEARDTTARSPIELLGAAPDAYRLANGRYPTPEQGLAALWREPASDPRRRNWRGPYLRKEVPLDPWQQSYVFKSPGEVNPT